MNPEGSVFFKGGKENSHLYIYLQLTHFVRHVQGIKLGTHAHTLTHTHFIPYQMTRKKKKKKQDDVACCTRKKKIKNKRKRDPTHTHNHQIDTSQSVCTSVRPGPRGPLVTVTTPLFLLEMSGCPRPLGRGGVCARQAGSKEGGRESSMSVQVYHHDGRRGCSPLAHNSPRARAGEGGSSSTQWGPIYSGGHRNNNK